MKPPPGFAPLLSGVTPAGAAVEAALLVACLLGAYLAVRLLRGDERPVHSIWFGARLYDGVLFPLLALLLALAVPWVLRGLLPAETLNLAVPILVGLLMVRLSARVLRVAFPDSRLVRRLERSLSWLVWIGLVLWLTGVLPRLAVELEQLHWRVGGVEMSLLTLLQGALSSVAVLLAALWISSAIEASLLKGAVGHELSARKIAANAVRALLLLVGLLMAMSAAGIPLSALSVMGGAIGVGIGLGLQKLAANYVSGFVILAERSLRIGDVVKVDDFEGRITDIKTRYTVIRALNGRESIVPNELLITQRVENASLADRNVALNTVLQVAYGSELGPLLPRLAMAMLRVPRVLADPPPGVQLSRFADSGLELTALFWIGDPENGTGNVRSAVNLALLAELDAAGVEIPFPQRVLRLLPAPGTSPDAGALAP